jgi:hypothetical protein
MFVHHHLRQAARPVHGRILAVIVDDDDEIHDLLVNHFPPRLLDRVLGVVGGHDDDDFLVSDHAKLSCGIPSFTSMAATLSGFNESPPVRFNSRRRQVFHPPPPDVPRLTPRLRAVRSPLVQQQQRDRHDHRRRKAQIAFGKRKGVGSKKSRPLSLARSS